MSTPQAKAKAQTLRQRISAKFDEFVEDSKELGNSVAAVFRPASTNPTPGRGGRDMMAAGGLRGSARDRAKAAYLRDAIGETEEERKARERR